METFDCSMCGKCCMHMTEVIEALPLLENVIGKENAYFPYSHNDGICEKLILENNLCSIYEDRPIICNFEKYTEIVAQRTSQDLQLIRKFMIHEGNKKCKQLQTK